MRRRFSRLALSRAGLFAESPVAAGPVLKDTLAVRFTPEDLALMKGRGARALDSNPEGRTFDWSNLPRPGHPAARRRSIA